MNTNDIKLIIENIAITDYLPQTPKCNICEGKNILIRNNHLYCNDCEEFNNFFKSIYYNNPDIKEGVAFEKKLLAKAQEFQAEKDFIKSAAALPSMNLSIAEFNSALKATKDKSLTLINAPTGCGKTYTSVKYAIDCVKNGEQIAFVCSTIEEVNRVVGIIKGYGFEDLSVVISGLDTEPKKFRNILITTYAYLATKGDGGEPFSIGKKILLDRIVICDEIQMIETYSNKIIPLCGRYQPEGNALKLREQCLHYMRKGGCENCHLIIESIVDVKTQEYTLYPRLPLVEKYSKQINNLLEDDIFKLDFYKGPAINTLKTQKIEPDAKLFKQFPFIAESIANFEDLELRMQFPYFEESGIKNFLTREEILKLGEDIKGLKVKYPKYTCGVPSLHCKSKMIYENLFSFAKKIIGMSATIPTGVRTDFEQKSAEANFTTQLINIDSTPVKYNVTALKLDRKLSHSDVAAILKAIDTPTFLVEATMYDAKMQYDELTKDSELALRIMFFKQGDYISIQDLLSSESKVENCSGRIKLTYANSAICRAKDMPEINFVIVDCSQFLPTLALDYKDDSIDELKMRDIQTKNISDKLHQIVGRVFRSKLNYNPNITQVDGRQIVLLLHNLPYELQEFKPDSKILNTYQEYRNEEVTGLQDKQRKTCIIKTIQEVFNNKKISNKGLEQKCEAMKKALEVGVTKLNRRLEYDLLDEEDRNLIISLKHVKNSYKELMSYFAKRYNFTPSSGGTNE